MTKPTLFDFKQLHVKIPHDEVKIIAEALEGDGREVVVRFRNQLWTYLSLVHEAKNRK